MRRVMLGLAGLALGLAAATSAAAAGSSGWSAGCVQDLLLDQKLQGLDLAQVTGEGPVHFQAQDRAGCPGAAPQCQRKAYVVAGDLVVVGPRRGAWTCVVFPNGAGGTEGWVRSDRLAPAASAASPGVQDWAGDWVRDRQASIKLRPKGPKLAVDGLAFWTGSNPGQTNDGGLSGEARPQGDLLRVGDVDNDACQAALRLLGRYLVVGDNGQCGGLNVSFAGVYRRKAARAGE